MFEWRDSSATVAQIGIPPLDGTPRHVCVQTQPHQSRPSVIHKHLGSVLPLGSTQSTGMAAKGVLLSYLKAYIAALIIFGAIDATWLRTMGPIVYRPALAEILTPNLRIAPAIVFYLMYPVGIMVFAIMPALRSGSLAGAAALASLFGAIAYATYDLTNYAILRAWTLQITILDIAYGALASGVAAMAGFLLVRFTTR